MKERFSVFRSVSLLLLVTLASFVFVTQTGSAQEKKGEEKKDAAPQATSAPAFTKEALDASWAKRHTEKEAFLELVAKKPAVPSDYEVAWRLSRLAFYAGYYGLPDNAKDKRMVVFQYGMDAANAARKLNKARVEGHYYYAVNQGVHGLAKGIIASLKGAEPMKQALDEAIAVDPSFDFGGPYRLRGRMYFKLPGGFVSFGDNKKSLEDLKKAVSLSPKNKLNLVYLAETQIKVESKEEAAKTLEIAKATPATAGVDEEAAYQKALVEVEEKIR